MAGVDVTDVFDSRGVAIKVDFDVEMDINVDVQVDITVDSGDNDAVVVDDCVE